MRLWALSAFALLCGCSDDDYRVVTGPSDAYDLTVVEGEIVARGPEGLRTLRLAGGSSSATPLQSLELGHGARLNLPTHTFLGETGATVALPWLDAGSVVAARSGDTCVVAFESGNRDAPTHEIAFLSCRDGRMMVSTRSDMRAVDLIGVNPNAVLVARRGDGVTRLELVDTATGKQRWSHDTRPGTGDPIVVEQEALVVHGDNRIVAFGLEDGKQREMTLRLPDGHSISAIGPTDRPGHFAMASCLCVQAGAVIESSVSLVDARDATSKRLAKLPKAFAALDVVLRGKQIVVVGYTNAASKPQPSDLDVAPK